MENNEFRVRPYQEADLADCTTYLYESFFTCPISKEDQLFLQEYIQVLLEKCNFTLVAENKGDWGCCVPVARV